MDVLADGGDATGGNAAEVVSACAWSLGEYCRSVRAHPPALASHAQYVRDAEQAHSRISLVVLPLAPRHRLPACFLFRH